MVKYTTPKATILKIDFEGIIAQSDVNQMKFGNVKGDDPQLSNQRDRGGIWNNEE